MRPIAGGDGAQNVDRCGEGDAVVDRHGRIVEMEIRRMQNKAAIRLHRSAGENLYAFRALRQADQIVG